MTEHELSSQQKNLWLRGVSAYQQKNFDYAVTLILSVVKDAPKFLEGRRVLRRAEAERFKGQKKGLFGGMSFSLKGGASAKKEPWEAIQDLEDNVFQKDPYSESGNQTLYDYATRIAEHDLAAFALETIREGHPTNTRNLHRLAEHYMAHDLPEKAGDVYRQVIRQDPTDMDAAKGEKDSAAKTSMMRQGWQADGASSFRSAMKNSEEAQALENMARQGMTKEQMQQLLAQFASEYEKDPNNVNVVKRIADVYERMDEHEHALSYFEWAVQLNPADVSLQLRAEQIRNKIADGKIHKMEAEIEAQPDAPDIAEKRAQIKAIKEERLATVLADAKDKVERNPTDKQYRFDLARVLYDCEQYREAIPQLQQAKSNPHIRTKALLMLGRCFERLNMNDLAVNSFNESLKEMPVFNNEKKELLYDLGMVYHKTGKNEDYLNCMKEIYNNDYGYKDVAGRVEGSYQ